MNFYFYFNLSVWEAYGVKIIVNTADIATRSGCEKLFKAALALGPIGGIFNLAVQLRDAILENQTTEKFIECLQPKATATEYLGKQSLQFSFIMCVMYEFDFQMNYRGNSHRNCVTSWFSRVCRAVVVMLANRTTAWRTV